mmetsp:Transcript_33253/g.103053  ORF Transcript_33253/g.103053 Transcript_33253/m.103053 type:complete len:356 (+) Transcript_33253:195-1262(+)
MHVTLLLLLGAARALVAPAVTAPIASKLAEVQEPAARALAEAYEVVDLPSSRTTFVRTAAARDGGAASLPVRYLRDANYLCAVCGAGVVETGRSPPLVLLHGFDSSALEFRRLLPALEARGVAAYALDVAGWGLTEPGDAGVSVEAKRKQVEEFCREVVGGPCVLAGASLGAAVVVDAVANGGVAPVKVALLGPQCMIDGAPPVPEWGARLGVRVLRSWPLRALANRIAYKDKSLGTKDAIRVGLLHCERDGWEDDAVAWLLGGGYSVSELVSPALRDAETLILWGESDEILPPADALPQFVEALPGADIRYVAECGHVPHLEQPGATATALARFLDEGANLGYVSGTTSVASAR